MPDKTPNVPALGTPATIYSGSDAYPYYVQTVEDRSGSTIIGLQQGDAKVVSGSAHDGSAEWECSMNALGSWSYYKGTSKGWREVQKNPKTGRWVFTSYSRPLAIGKARRYHDPHF